MEEFKKLPDAELEIMMLIWQAGSPVTSSYLMEQLRGKKKWVLPTLLSFLSRLRDKGFLTVRREGKSNVYTAVVDEEKYRANEIRSFLERMCGNSLKTFVSSLYHGKAIGDDDLDELRRFIDGQSKQK